MNMFFGFILTMGFVTSLPVSKKINVDYYDIEALQRNEVYGRNTAGWRILCFIYFPLFVTGRGVSFIMP